MFSEEIVNKLKSKPCVCFAPYNTLNFGNNGNITVCCYNNNVVLGVYPQNSIKEAWASRRLVQLRNNLQNLNFNNGCQLCAKQLQTGNYSNSLLSKKDEIAYDESQNYTYPRVMEFELHNACNYECIMCGGKWSSLIRKNREGLAPLAMRYDSKFVDQLEEFIPHLFITNFLGGEPFIIPLYYEIWNRIAKINNNVKINITTNGSILNEKVKRLLSCTKNVNIICSLDSLNSKTYSYIRRNGSLETVLNNLSYFLKCGALKGITFNPMIQNWHNIPSIISYCKKHHLQLYFNTVTEHLGGDIKGIHKNGTCKRAWDEIDNPCITKKLSENEQIPSVSLYTLPFEEKQKIIKFLEPYSNENNQYGMRVRELILSIKTFNMSNTDSKKGVFDFIRSFINGGTKGT